MSPSANDFAGRFMAIVDEMRAYEIAMTGQATQTAPLEGSMDGRIHPVKIFMLTALGTNSPLPFNPSIIGKLRALQKDMKGMTLEDAFFENQLTNCILSRWPSKELLAVVHHDTIISSPLESLKSLRNHLTKPDKLDPDRWRQDPTYGKRWEDRRAGLLETYIALRALGDITPDERKNDDANVFKVTARDIRQRFEAVQKNGWSPALEAELRLYADAGLLGTAYEKIGKQTGYTSGYDYLHALAEHVIPQCPNRELREEMWNAMPAAEGWVTYLRDRSVVHPNSVTAHYTQPRTK